MVALTPGPLPSGDVLEGISGGDDDNTLAGGGWGRLSKGAAPGHSLSVGGAVAVRRVRSPALEPAPVAAAAPEPARPRDEAEEAKRAATAVAKQVAERIEREIEREKNARRLEREARHAASARTPTLGAGGEVKDKGGDALGDAVAAGAQRSEDGVGRGGSGSKTQNVRTSHMARANRGGTAEEEQGARAEPKRRQAWLATLLKPEHRARLAPALPMEGGAHDPRLAVAVRQPRSSGRGKAAS